MVNKMIYLLFRRAFNTGETELISPHATFDGCRAQLDDIRDYWSKHGYAVQPNKNGALLVKNSDGRPVWFFFVNSRTIEE